MSNVEVGDKVFVEGKLLKIDENNYHKYQVSIDSAYIAWAHEVQPSHEKLECENKDYENGMRDALDLLNMLASILESDGVESDNLRRAFGEDDLSNIIAKYSIEAIVEKMGMCCNTKALCVGDIVTWFAREVRGLKHGVVTALLDSIRCYVLWDNGICEITDRESLWRTGKSAFDDVDKLLTKIGELDEARR